MLISGLSEQELKEIQKILDLDSIRYEIATSNQLKDKNADITHDPLNHYNTGRYTTHILSLKLGDDAFHKMSKSTKFALMALGITDQEPDPADFEPEITPKKEAVKKYGEKMMKVVLFIFGVSSLIGIFKSSFQNF